MLEIVLARSEALSIPPRPCLFQNLKMSFCNIHEQKIEKGDSFIFRIKLLNQLNI